MLSAAALLRVIHLACLGVVSIAHAADGGGAARRSASFCSRSPRECAASTRQLADLERGAPPRRTATPESAPAEGPSLPRGDLTATRSMRSAAAISTCDRRSGERSHRDPRTAAG